MRKNNEITDECISLVFRVSCTFCLLNKFIYEKGAKFKTFAERMKNKNVKG